MLATLDMPHGTDSFEAIPTRLGPAGQMQTYLSSHDNPDAFQHMLLLVMAPDRATPR